MNLFAKESVSCDLNCEAICLLHKCSPIQMTHSDNLLYRYLIQLNGHENNTSVKFTIKFEEPKCYLKVPY